MQYIVASDSEATKQSQKQIASLPYGRLAMTEGEIATPPLREARNDREVDCHGLPTGALASMGIGF